MAKTISLDSAHSERPSFALAQSRALSPQADIAGLARRAISMHILSYSQSLLGACGAEHQAHCKSCHATYSVLLQDIRSYIQHATL